ncbi:conserved hypothetical protein [Pseudarthrobacter chlorophenolicus A6]|uniref:LysM domain-containing protein n=2 Tax=Pseudarthrobacter chlorophenolicus TaxID=85085 RepID=B8HBL2_PSECP|nr:conserved hypothetical protein [Pseudarthrobacter chlorophenolicus A6]SDQ82285.1 Nucleoid-associated protein YgaU, contains BON and LysM domains [Pseudarthrobacter chlorophenolicus]
MKRDSHGARYDALIASALLVLGALLVFIGFGLVQQWEVASDRHQSTSAEDILGAVALISGSILIAWWFLSLLAAAAGVLLERRGNDRAASLTRRLSPAFMRRLVVAAVSLQLVSGAAANAETLAPGPQWAPTQEYASAMKATPESPAASTGPAGRAMEDATSTPATAPGAGHPEQALTPGLTPTSTAREELAHATPETAPITVDASSGAAGHSQLQPRWQPRTTPLVDPAMLAPPATREEATTGGDSDHTTGTVAVLAGDTLWDIVRTQLGSNASDIDVALEWPRWYEANKAVIGQNPDVLLPGQVLQPPSPS